MAAEDYFDCYVFDDYGCEDDDPGYQGNDVTCKHCGAKHLDWVHTGVRWRLLNSDGRFHVCNTAASADDFEVVS